MKKLLFVFVLILVMLTMLVSCAPGTRLELTTAEPGTTSATPVTGNLIDVPGIYSPGVNPLANTNDAYGRVAGFFPGIWHGIISPVTLILSVINSNIQMYEVHNNGSQYNFGFLIGVAIVFLLLGVFAGSRRRRG